MVCTICIVIIKSLYVLTLVCGVDCVYGVSIRVNVNDGNDVGPNRAIPLATILFYIDYDKTFDKTN